MLNPVAFVQLIATMGESVRWFKCLPTYDGTHISSTSATAGRRWAETLLPARVKVLAREQKDEFEHPDFGLVHVGDLILTTLPDEITVGFQDIFVFPLRTDIAREAVTRGAGADALVQSYPVRLVAVSDATRAYTLGTTGDCYLDANNEIAWTVAGEHPAEDAVYTAEYTYNQVYWYMSGKERAPRPIPFLGGTTPQQVVLTKKLPGD